MAITTLAQLTTAARQTVSLTSTVSRGGSFISSRFDATGEPTGTLAGSSTTAGVVPTSATAGYPRILPFSGSNTGYLGNIQATNIWPCRMVIFDRLWLAGAYAFNASVTLTGQPSYSARVPNGNFNDLEIWVETVTSITGNLTIAVGYTNQDGVNSRSTGTVTFGTANSTHACFRFPLQSGDSGVQQINSVVSTVATAGTFNIMVLRRLAETQISAGNEFDKVSVINGELLPQVYSDSALYVLTRVNGAAGTQLVRVRADILQG